jgi:hypothetical protein
MSGVPHFALTLRSPSAEPIRAVIPGAQVLVPRRSRGTRCTALYRVETLCKKALWTASTVRC